MGPLTDPDLLKAPFFVLLCIAAGLAATFYNRTLLAALRTTDRFPGLPVELRAGMVGAAVGAIAWFAPSLVGGGDGLAQQALSGVGTLVVLPIPFQFRLGLICGLLRRDAGADTVRRHVDPGFAKRAATRPKRETSTGR